MTLLSIEIVPNDGGENMWTGLGVIYFVILLAIPIVKWIGIFLIGSAAGATGKSETKRRIEEANKQKQEQERLDRNRIMTKEVRETLREQNPNTVIVGETYDIRREWKDGKGWVYPFTINEREYYWSSKKQPPQFIRRASDSYTKSLYVYIKKVEFLDEVPEDVWCRENNITEHKDYELERKRQCEQYCNAISMLAHKYIYFGQYEEFKHSFILALIQNKKLALSFIKECHAANIWKEENNQLYDCDNYMKDFMEENHIRYVVDSIAGHKVEIPDDFRHFRPNTPSTCAAKYIAHELKKRERPIRIAQTELKSHNWWGAAFASTIVGILFLIWLFNSPTDDFTIHLKRVGFVIGLAAWALVIGKASVGYNSVEKVKSESGNDEYYRNSFPGKANNDGEKYAKILSEEILQHPTPYKYYV